MAESSQLVEGKMILLSEKGVRKHRHASRQEWPKCHRRFVTDIISCPVSPKEGCSFVYNEALLYKTQWSPE